MKKLIVVRHGLYSNLPGFPLSDAGRKQMASLGSQIRAQHTNGTTPRILSSIAPRAKESAEILAAILGAEVELEEALWSENGRPVQLDKVLSVLSNNGNIDVVIVVTHLEYTYELPEAFGEKVLGARLVTDRELNKGDAWVIDCVEKKIEFLHSRN